MTEYCLQTQDLAVGYNGTALIRDICLNIRKGEIVSLIGPNGSGKSTILKSITGHLKTISGRVCIDDLFLQELSRRELSKRLAVMLTDRIAPELMTCRDIVATGRYPFTGRLGLLRPEDEEIVTRAMESVHVSELENRDFNAISDGQRQRVLLARAICQKPEIIVLDEPTSYLDIRHKLELLSLLRSMAKQNGITVVMSLHEIDLAQKISDKVVCVRGETISCFGAPEEVFTEDRIRELYGIESGTYDPLFGSVEFAAPAGEPRVLVLSACGSGIPVFRRLRQEGIPFAAGIFSRNDIDYYVARHLAAELIETEPFAPLSRAALDRAVELMNRCEYVLDTGVVLGETNRLLGELLEQAEKCGKLRKDYAVLSL